MKLSDFKGPYIIADIGSNLFTSNNPTDNLIMAKRHIHDAARAGVSAVKFQFYTDKELYGMEGPNKYHLPSEWLLELSAYATENSVDFMCTAFSEDGYRIINPFVNLHKVASSEMKHIEILKEVVRTDKPFLISTGGANEGEIKDIGEFLFDMDKEPGKDFGFLECVANYPANPSDYNLKVLQHKDMLDDGTWVGVQYVGVSDHTKTNVVAITSVGLGARIFEKHFTAFDHPWGDHLYGDDCRQVMTPDYPVSIGPIAMTQYVRDLRQAFTSLGDGKKHRRATEKDMTMRWRRRLKVTEHVKEGQMLKFGKNFGIYRSITDDPHAGPPEHWEQFDQGLAKKDLNPGDPIWAGTVAV